MFGDGGKILRALAAARCEPELHGELLAEARKQNRRWVLRSSTAVFDRPLLTGKSLSGLALIEHDGCHQMPGQTPVSNEDAAAGSIASQIVAELDLIDCDESIEALAVLHAAARANEVDEPDTVLARLAELGFKCDVNPRAVIASVAARKAVDKCDDLVASQKVHTWSSADRTALFTAAARSVNTHALEWAVSADKQALERDSASKSDSDRAEPLIERKIDNNTPLMLATEKDNYQAAKFLLLNGADPNARSKQDGQTPLQAVKSLELVKLLVGKIVQL